MEVRLVVNEDNSVELWSDTQDIDECMFALLGSTVEFAMNNYEIEDVRKIFDTAINVIADLRQNDKKLRLVRQNKLN